MAEYAVPPREPLTLPVAGSAARYPIHHVYAVTRNYGAGPMPRPSGDQDDRPLPAIFTKAPDSVVPSGQSAPYPPATGRLEPEVEMVVAIGGSGRRLDPNAAREIVFGYGVGLDMTRRDLQAAAREEGKPWDTAKWFDGATPVSEIRPVTAAGHPEDGAITLDVNGARVQTGDLNQMIWKPAEVVAIVSRFFTLQPGDLIFSGTPAGETVVQSGDDLFGAVEGVGSLRFHIE